MPLSAAAVAASPTAVCDAAAADGLQLPPLESWRLARHVIPATVSRVDAVLAVLNAAADGALRADLGKGPNKPECGVKGEGLAGCWVKPWPTDRIRERDGVDARFWR